MKHLFCSCLFPSLLIVARLAGMLAVVAGGLLGAGPVAAQAPTWEWAKTGGQDTYNTSTVVDSAGNVYVVGLFQYVAAFGSIRLTNAGSGGYVAKLTQAGVYVWAVPLAVPPMNDSHVLALDRRGNVLVTGNFESDTATFGPFTLVQRGPGPNRSTGFVAKLDPTGAWQWAQGFDGGNHAVGRAVAADRSGNVVITGSFSGDTASFGTIHRLNAAPGSGFDDLFVAKLSPAGTWLWALSAGGDRPDAGTGIGVDARGDVVVGGYFDSPTLRLGATALTSGAMSYNGEVFVGKLSSAGAWQWATHAGSPSLETCKGLAVDSAGDVTIAGELFGTSATFGSLTITNPLNTPANFISKIYVARLSAAGGWQWATSAGDTSVTFLAGLTVDRRGTVYVTGEFTGPSIAFGPVTVREQGQAYSHSYVAQLTAGGVWQWGVTIGSDGSSLGRSIAADERGAVYVAGGVQGLSNTVVRFGPLILPRDGGYLARLSTLPLPPRLACAGDTLRLGAPAPPGTVTRWTPTTYLSSDTAAQPLLWLPATPPRADTTYGFVRNTEQTAIGVRGGAAADRLTVRVAATALAPRLLSISVDTLDERRVVGSFTVPRATDFAAGTGTLDGQPRGQGFAPLATTPLPAAGALGTVATPALPPGAAYRLRAEGACEVVVSGAHVPVTLAADAADSLGFTTLRWTAYRGWADAPGPVSYSVLAGPEAGAAHSPIWSGPDTLLRLPPAAGPRHLRIHATAADGRRSASNAVTLAAAPAVRAYNILTPNNDGANDAFVVDNLAAYPGTALAVYSRWGREVYRAADYRSGSWRAEGLGAGIYFYHLALPDGRTVKGWVEVVR